MKEIHTILRSQTLEGLISAESGYLSSHPSLAPVCRRWLLSDASQRALIQGLHKGSRCAESYIVQPPLDGSTAALWLCLAEDADDIHYDEGYTVVRCGTVEFFWTSGLNSVLSGSDAQTREILEGYEAFLKNHSMTVGDNCIRTWFYCHDIDDNYAGLVKARRENFIAEGLTPGTHYIASTGICGTPCREEAVVQMDAVAVRGVFSQRYLYAPTHLNPTYEYGVTFERGVRVDIPSMSPLVIISGTASIDNRGNVLHVGDVVAQTHRMWENVETLLAEGGAGWNDVRHVLVYLRNASDYDVVAPMFAAKFPDVPYVILHAPVCRPDWLIEMECVATPMPD